MAASEKYKSTFQSQLGTMYTIWVTTQVPYVDDDLTPTYNFTLKSYGFKNQWQGEGSDIYDPIKTSSLSFTWMIDSVSDRLEVTTIVSNPDQNWYVTLLKDNRLDWFGYLKLENFQIDNNDPTEVDLEAHDNLTILKDLTLTDVGLDTSDVINYGTDGLNGFDLAFRFGRPRRYNNSTSLFGFQREDATSTPTKIDFYATILEHIWSIIYDADPELMNSTGTNDGPGHLSLLVATEHDDRINYATETTHAFEELYLAITQPFDDYRSRFFPFSPTGNTAADSLKNICQTFNLRIFQSDGRYWVVQPRLYLNASFSVYNYEPNSTPSTSTTPVKTSGPTSSLPQISNDKVTVTYGNTAKVEAGSVFEYKPAIQKVKVEVHDGAGKIRKVSKITATTPFNYSGFSQIKKDVGFVDLNLTQVSGLPPGGSPPKLGDLFVRTTTVHPTVETNPSLTGVRYWSSLGGFRETSTVKEFRAGNIFNVAELISYQRMLSQNGVSTVLKGNIYSQELSFFQPIVYDSNTFMCMGMTRFGNIDQVNGEWVKFDLNLTNLETGSEEANEGDGLLLDTNGDLILDEQGSIIKV